MNPGTVIRAAFPGDAEGRVFGRLQSLWSKRYNIWLDLPLSLVLGISSSDAHELQRRTVDFTVCTKEDKPLMCVELETGDSGKSLTAEARAAAQAAGLAVHLLSIRETPLPQDYAAKIVDTIISTTIGQRDLEEEYQEYELLQQPFLDHVATEMPGEGSSPMILDWYGGDEVDAAMKYRPLADEIQKLRRDFTESDRWSCPWGRGQLSCSMKANLSATRIESQGDMLGCVLNIATHVGEATSGLVWVSDFDRAEEVASELATALALDRALQLIGQRR